MQRSLSQMLLVDNELYLDAVQHKSIQIGTLGLQEVRYPFNSIRNTSGKKVLRAVIPADDQREFLQKAGLLDTTVPAIPEILPVHDRRTSQQRRKDRAARRKAHEEKEKRDKSPKKQEEEDPHVVKHAARRTSIGGTPLFTKPSQTQLAIMEREREDAIWRTKQKERFVKLGENFDLVDKDGVKYVYDYRGFKVTEEEFERQQAELERSKQRSSVERTILPHKSALIEKTRKFVDDMRRKVEEDMILDYRWYPGKFPSTTVPPRCQSAGSSRRSLSNSLRDINSLGKSLPSPFRSGETPVLPVDLVHKWPEYRVMEEGDVVLTIEHCCNCAEHCMMTHHKEEHYSQLADEVKESLSATAMKFAVRFYAVHKPVQFQDPLHRSLSQSEKLINKESDGQRPEIKAFNVDYTTRLGAFEVQVAIKTRQEFICHLLFSKLFRGVWPKVGSLQKLLERLLTEARFKRLDSDEPEENLSPKSRKLGMRRESAKVVLVPKKADEDVVSELMAEFDLREKATVQLEAAPPAGSKVPFEAQKSIRWDAATDSKNSAKVQSGAEVDTKNASTMNGGGAGAAPAGGPEPTAASPGDGTMSLEEELQEAYLRYQVLQRAAQLQRGQGQPAEPSPPGSFGFEDSPAPSRAGSVKASVKALGHAAAGLHLVRKKSQSERPAVHDSLISAEQAMEIANTHSHSERRKSDGDQPQAHFTKKLSSIGVLSRQNAGGGQGRYLHIEDEDSSTTGLHIDTNRSESVSSPAMLTRASSVASHTGSSSKSPFARSNTSVSPSSAKGPLNRGSSTVSVTPFTRASSTMHHVEENEYEDSEQVGFSPGNSSKSITPVATAVALTTTGLALVRHRAASISAISTGTTVAEKLKGMGHKAKSERMSGTAGRNSTSPKGGQHRPHPSLEMRKKLDIGMLSRQEAAKGGKLVIPDDDSDDGAGSDLSDDPPPRPLKKITDAMKDAVTAVNVATEASEKRVTAAAAGHKPSPSVAHPAGVVIAEIPPFVPAATHGKSTLESLPSAPAEELDVHVPQATAGAAGERSAASASPAPVEAQPAVRNSPSVAQQEKVVPPTEPTAAPAVTVAPAVVLVPTPPPVADSTESAITDPPVVADGPPAEAPSAPVHVEPETPAGPKMSATEMLQNRRRMTEQLLSDVSKDILRTAGIKDKENNTSSTGFGEYGDDFEDEFDNFSPSARNNNGGGFEDLFETSEFQLSQTSEG